MLFFFVSFHIAPKLKDYSLYSGEKTTLFSCEKTKIVVIYRNECEKLFHAEETFITAELPPPKKKKTVSLFRSEQTKINDFVGKQTIVISQRQTK